MTGQIRQSIRKRHRLLKIHSKCKSPVSWDRYRVQRNLVVCLVRKAKIHCKLLAILQHLPKTDGALKSLYGNKCYSAIPAICEGHVLMSGPKRGLCKVRIRTVDGGWRTADGGRRTADGTVIKRK